jgi:hypothetical protein
MTPGAHTAAANDCATTTGTHEDIIKRDTTSIRINWERIDNFIGFGFEDAPVVFIGMEEGLKNAGALDEDLVIRSTYATPIMDLKEAHIGIAGTEHYFEPDRAPRQPTWRVMADLMLRREQPGMTPTAADRRRYRATRLGRSGGDTLLTVLLPYPHPKSNDWLYKRFDKYKTRDDYESDMLPKRRRLLRSVIGTVNRDLIVCYGKGNWPQFQELFDDVTLATRYGFYREDDGAQR